MKRPVAVFGAGYWLASLLAIYVPQTASWLLAVLFGLPAFVFLWHKNTKVKYCCVIGLSISLALGCFYTYNTKTVKPVLAQIPLQQKCTIAGIVYDPQGVEGGEWVNARLRVDAVGGQALAHPAWVQLRRLPPLETGDRVSLTAVLTPVENTGYGRSLYADGVFLSGTYIDAVVLAPVDVLPLSGRLMQWKETLAQRLRTWLPQDTGAIAAAMSLGENSFLSPVVKAQFRGAGLSHALVVSGMHLGIVSAGIYLVLKQFLKPKVVSLLCCIVLFVFIGVSGVTPSLVRAGAGAFLLYSAVWAGRRSDGLTALGLSLMLLCLQNPYAAADAGLLLSYSATLGVLYSIYLLPQLLKARTPSTVVGHMALWLLEAALVSACAMAFTLPVLISIGSSVSLLTIFCNVLAAPLLAVIVSTGIVLALVAGVAFLAPLAQMLGLVCGVAVNLLYAIAKGAAAFPFGMVHISGATAVFVCLALGAWVALGHKTERRLRVTAAFAALFFVLSVGIYAVADANVVRVAVVGGGQNPCVVITQRLKTLVVLRGPRDNVAAVEEYLRKRNRTQVELLVDLRPEAKDTQDIAQAFFAKKTIIAAQDIVNSKTETIFYGIIGKLQHQSQGNAFLCKVGDYTIGVSAGKFDFSNTPAMDLYVSGSARPENLTAKMLLLPQARPRWQEDFQPKTKMNLLESGEEPLFLLRTGRSIQMKEVERVYGAQ